MPPSPIVRGWRHIEPLPLSGSERRLFRLRGRINDRLHNEDTDEFTSSAILVDARLEAHFEAKDSSHAPYLQRLQELTFFLTRAGLRVPRIEAIDCAHGVAIVEDLGENSYARCLDLRGVDACRPLFQRAVEDLIRLSRIDTRIDKSHALEKLPDCLPDCLPDFLPDFSEERFVEQTLPFADAFLTKEQRRVWQELWRERYRDAAFEKGELALVLGDVHVENMFAVSERNEDGEEDGEGGGEEGGKDCGERCVFIDFQDAHIAPRCYDVVSLLEDGLWSMPAAQREALWRFYRQAHAGSSAVSAARHYALCALHREVRMLGILHRLLRVRCEERYGVWLATTAYRCRRRLAEHACFGDIRQFLERSLGFDWGLKLEKG